MRVANAAPTVVQVVSSGYVLVKNCNGAIVAAYKLPGASTTLQPSRRVASNDILTRLSAFSSRT